MAGKGNKDLRAAARRLQIYWIIAILFICVGTVTAFPTPLHPWRPPPDLPFPTHRIYYPPPPRRPSPRPRRSLP